MEILLFNEKGLAKVWYLENVNTPFVDKVGTEERKKIWEKKLEVCRREGYRYGGHFVLIISIRSRMRPANIPEEEMKEFNALVDKLKANNQKTAI
jgi:hypothetical protein